MCDTDTTVAYVPTRFDFATGESVPHWIFSPAEHHGDQEADARLIAAAPELLEALELAVEQYERDYPGLSENPQYACIWYQKAKAAIAKATK
jgi:hypothetical protein